MEARTLWRGQRDTTRRAFRLLMVLSLILHLPLTPLASLLGAWRAFSDVGDPIELPEMNAIPIDLIEDEGPVTPPPPAEPAPAEPVLSPEPVPPEQEPEAPRADRDAGAPDAGPEDAGPEDAGADDAGPVADAGPSDAGLSDPIALKGAVRDVVDPNANVVLRIYTARIRKLPQGPRVGRLLGSIYQWRDFFGPAGIDPIKDVDQILVIGPQLRDSSGVVAVLKLSVSEERLHQSIDGLVRAQGGQWVEDAGVPTALAQADRAPRVFVMAGSGVVVVAPPRLTDDVTGKAKALTRVLRESAGQEVLSAKVKTPANALRGIFAAPKSITLAKVHVLPTPGGGAEIVIEAEDESEEMARESADYLQRNVTAATELDLGLLGGFIGLSKTKFVERVEFSAQGEVIHGRITLTRDQIDTLLNFAESYVVGPRPKPKPKTAPAPSAPQR